MCKLFIIVCFNLALNSWNQWQFNRGGQHMGAQVRVGILVATESVDMGGDAVECGLLSKVSVLVF